MNALLWARVLEPRGVAIAIALILMACVFPLIAQFVLVEESTLGQP
jgi:hypothetical protein